MAKSTNFQKLKKDSEINFKKATFYTKKASNELKSKVDSLKIPEKFPKLLNSFKDLRKNLNLTKLDDLKSNKIEEWNYKFEEKVKSSFNSMKQLMKKSKEVPKQTVDLSKGFGREVKTYFSESYTQGVAHVKNYLKANEKYFSHKRKEFENSFRKKKNNIFIIVAGFVFVYAVGANIPNAIVKYKLAQENSRYAEELDSERRSKVSGEVNEKKEIKEIEIKEPGSNGAVLSNADSGKPESKA